MSAATPAIEAVEHAGVAYRLLEYSHRGGAVTATDVADVLDLDPARVFKTLLVDIPDGNAVAIVAAHRQLDLRALSRELGVKRSTMADERTAERVSRSVVGAISPFGLPRRLPTVLDESAADHPTIFVSAGRRGLELELSPGDLVSVLGCRTAPITT